MYPYIFRGENLQIFARVFGDFGIFVICSPSIHQSATPIFSRAAITGYLRATSSDVVMQA